MKPIEPTRLWFKETLAARLGAERDAEALVQRIEKTFGEAPDGPAAACRSAAIQQRMYVGAMNNMVALAEGHGQPAALDLLSALWATAVASPARPPPIAAVTWRASCRTARPGGARAVKVGRPPPRPAPWAA